jgi:hypothetical protein
MQVSLERSGGFTGISLSITVDTATLPPDQATQLDHLVKTADFFNLPTTIDSPTQPDRFQYQVSVQEGDRQHTVMIRETAVPANLKPLINWLTEALRRRETP